MTDDPKKPCSSVEADSSAATVNRRRFLSVTGASAGLMVVVNVIPGCGNATGSPPTGPVAAGNVSALSVDSLIVMGNVIVARDGNGVYAMSAVCTHQGCIVGGTSTTTGLHCPCHGSAFDGNGAVTHGPAASPLQHYAVTIAANGTMTVEGAQPVTADVRTPVA